MIKKSLKIFLGSVLALAVLVIAMVLSIWIFWGSVFSILMAFGLILMVPALLMQRFLNRDSEDDYWGSE